jgi:ABC-2 type transport system ATP-binding protein
LGNAIVTQGLTKDYGGGKGLFDLALAVREGEVFGYLGPNGAGKTTTIRLLMSLMRPTRGAATVFGLDTVARPVEIKRVVGYLPGELAQFGGLRGDEIVASMAALRSDVDRALVGDLAERFDLDLGRRYREYSRGNKQKLGIVLAFMHRPRLLILDEPTGGLDPLNQQTFYGVLREARERGATVFLSSHILSEVEAVCDRVGIIRAGRLVKVADLEELNELRQRRMEVQFSGDPPLADLRAVANVDQLEATGSTVRCVVKGDVDAFLRAIGRMHVVALSSEEPSLEEMFLAYYREG